MVAIIGLVVCQDDEFISLYRDHTPNQTGIAERWYAWYSW